VLFSCLSYYNPKVLRNFTFCVSALDEPYQSIHQSSNDHTGQNIGLILNFRLFQQFKFKKQTHAKESILKIRNTSKTVK